ncbi:MAG: DoxX family protein [Bryobacterales bacterium]|nr:DoxX family protein [Bryobacterales bacterium]
MSFSLSSTFIRRLTVALRLAMGLMFLYAAWTKLTQPWIQVAMTVEAYQLLPPGAVEFVARTLPWAELALGLWLISGVWLRWAASAASALLAAFLAVLVRSYVKGMQIECGCFGPGDPLSAYTLARDSTLLLLSLLLTALAFRRACRPSA